MPLACVFSHVPDARAALLIDDRLALTSCTRCGSGLFDNGEGWTSPLPAARVLRRRATGGSAVRRRPALPGRVGDATRALCLWFLLLSFGMVVGVAPHAAA